MLTVRELLSAILGQMFDPDDPTPSDASWLDQRVMIVDMGDPDRDDDPVEASAVYTDTGTIVLTF